MTIKYLGFSISILCFSLGFLAVSRIYLKSFLGEHLLFLSIALSLLGGYLILKSIEHTWFFTAISNDHATVKDIWLWWERRRLAYNIFAFTTMFLSLLGWLYFLVQCNPPGADFLSLFTAIFAPIGWNICYCLGPVIDICNHKVSSTVNSSILMKVGTVFSFLVIMFPATFWFCMWLQK